MLKIELKTKEEIFIDALVWLKNIEDGQKLITKNYFGNETTGYLVSMSQDNLDKINTLRHDIKIHHDCGNVTFLPIQRYIVEINKGTYFIEYSSRDLPKTLDDVYVYYKI